MSDVRPGMLLVATPALADPNFAETVVLMLDVNDDGSVGVVLNRPTGLAVAEVLGAWGEVVAEPEVLFQGGPVETDGALAVALRRGDDTGVLGLREVVDRLALLDLDTPVELVDDELDGLRIFAGYSGWGAGQLEREIEEGSWYVVPGLAPDVFRSDTTTLWRDVLRRQPGDLAMHSTRPADPGLN
ncbi:YqgE/AlgH family protein [Nocardioides sp. 1609]|uniref:YqgE/AlgH family protein n=1 Tax=Nocardioides sp. 1609 TaxID=2508327 RepID=UPI00106FCD17|nr:YqgE/AlgH family protein [Nocardioides sp. 1609]